MDDYCVFQGREFSIDGTKENAEALKNRLTAESIKRVQTGGIQKRLGGLLLFGSLSTRTVVWNMVVPMYKPTTSPNEETKRKRRRPHTSLGLERFFVHTQEGGWWTQKHKPRLLCP
jgi:hypothetical protein